MVIGTPVHLVAYLGSRKEANIRLSSPLNMPLHTYMIYQRLYLPMPCHCLSVATFIVTFKSDFSVVASAGTQSQPPRVREHSLYHPATTYINVQILHIFMSFCKLLLFVKKSLNCYCYFVLKEFDSKHDNGCFCSISTEQMLSVASRKQSIAYQSFIPHRQPSILNV